MKPVSCLAHYRDVDAANHSVKTHLVETSLFAKKFAGKIGLDLIGEPLGLLHDFMIWIEMGKNGKMEGYGQKILRTQSGWKTTL
ncbi:MAG: hypothetical protein LWW97_05035 [Deltaproteobacteria bacterium]|nr:hypothetical protein [Deltaproteobacteria bacterium]